ncbi:MAG: aminopeptidase [Caldilineaceae bacterium]|nr:aminopeptidase [Caldilineaceae bacterium]
MSQLETVQQQYADLLIQIGVNLQPGQCLLISAELGHAPFVRQLVAAAYQAGAKYVHVQWSDALVQRAHLRNVDAAHLTYFPAYEITRMQQMVDEQWARLALTGDEFPGALDDVDPKLIREQSTMRRRAMRFYSEAMMANRMQWCVAGVPTPAWAQKVFPSLSSQAALETMWQTIFQVCRIDQADPVEAWQRHDQSLSQVARYLNDHAVQALHFVDAAPGRDGRARTDLTVGLTDRPVWLAASSLRPDGVRFLPNMPTEEVFSTPHNQRTNGWIVTSKPNFPFDQRVEDAYFRFEGGELVDFSAAVGQEILQQFFEIDGARRLGEVALVDVRSPVNQAGVIFYDTLFDENAVCHIAFGDAYPGGVVDGDNLGEDELAAQGVNRADTHVDFMVGTDTMTVTGITATGTEVPVMENGQFVAAVLATNVA